MPPRTPHIFALAGVAVLLAACPKALPPPSAAETLQAQVRAIAEEVRALLRAQDELLWKSWTEGAPLDLAKSYLGRERAVSLESYRVVSRALAQARGEKANDLDHLRALSSLKTYLAGEFLARALSAESEALANLEVSMTFIVDGREYHYRELPRLLANEKSALRRRALYAGATPAYERLNQSLRRKEDRVAALLGELGYASYQAYAAEVRQADLGELRMLAEAVLAATDAPYKATLAKLAKRELGLPLEKLHRADLPRLFRSAEVDDAFPPAAARARAAQTLQGLGVDLSTKGLTLELSDQPKKSSRPLTVAVEIPSDIRVSLRLRGGVRDQAALFHELGHALHHLHTTPTRFELARLGSVVASETYAFLFEGLLDDPVWLEQHAGLSGERLRAHLEASSAHWLFLLRRASGRVLYQLAARSEAAADAPELHADVMSRAYGIAATADDAARYLVELDDFYQPADDLRAWVLAGQLHAQLKARFGPAWWTSAEAGALLRSLWAEGNGLSAEEIAARIGEKGLRPDVVVGRLQSALRVP